MLQWKVILDPMIYSRWSVYLFHMWVHAQNVYIEVHGEGQELSLLTLLHIH